ncbi:hypothetical protein [Streptomyces calvus]
MYLPGVWFRKYEGVPLPPDLLPISKRVWDVGITQGALLNSTRAPIALLHGPYGQELCVVARPLRPRQYLVAPLEPEGFKPHHFRFVDEPNSIAVPDDPVRAAAEITRRLLPRYRQALESVKHNAIIQPEPPHRPAAAEVAQTLTLVRYPDGAVGAPYASVPDAARTVLYSHCFHYSPHESAFLLPASHSEADRALLIQSAIRQLTDKGIGVNLRRAAPVISTTLPPSSPSSRPVRAR